MNCFYVDLLLFKNWSWNKDNKAKIKAKEIKKFKMYNDEMTHTFFSDVNIFLIVL